MDTYQYLWAKSNKEKKHFHPLICHLLDCGNVLGSLWDHVFTLPLRKQICKLLDLDDTETKKEIQFLSAIHDIGKASPAFQSSVEGYEELLNKKGIPFPKRSHYSPQRHDLISIWCLNEFFQSSGHLYNDNAELVSQVLGGHHGYFHSANEIKSSHRILNLGGNVWKELRSQIFNALVSLVDPPKMISLHGDIRVQQSTLVVLSGLIVAADWIASDDTLFPFFTDEDFSISDYNQLSKERAEFALIRTGWNAWKPVVKPIDFHEMFGFTETNPIQRAVIEHADDMQPPFLTILEAPTGQGKTEAAFYLADHIIQSKSLRGIYIAMPTMATSNQMFDRTAKYLENRYPHDLINLQLAHSQAQWNKSLATISLAGIGTDIEDRDQGIVALTWFNHKKRTLLAPFGVGTVDQVLMSVLQTKHFFLRLFGLAHKVIIFDEVHAYDVYMNTLFIRLLEWLKLLGCSVIILSATLPQKAKEQIAATYSPTPEKIESQQYPSLIMTDSNKVLSIPVDTGINQQYILERLGTEISEITDYLDANISGGGCAAVICNTVDKAQKVFNSIKNAGLIDLQSSDEELLLFHARFPFAWRDEIEKKVLDLFGRRGNRPKKAIVVATQVIEQSLDLDFDLMVTDLAPIDLLIQRAGRLQRHSCNKRPKNLLSPRLCLCLPEDDKETIDFGVNSKIYDEDILLATLFSLDKKNDLILPHETKNLIEKVYNSSLSSNFTKEQQEKINQLFIKSQAKHEKEIRIANEKLIPKAGDEHLLQIGKLQLEEDHPEIHSAFQALTRLMLPTITLVCLKEVNNQLYTLDGNLEVRLDEMPKPHLVEKLLSSSVSVARKIVVRHFAENNLQPHFWKINAFLRNCFPAVFHEGICRINEHFAVQLNRELGLIYLEG